MNKTIRTLFALIWIVLQSCSLNETRHEERLSFYFENDLFVTGKGTDQNYTNGIEVEYSYALEEAKPLTRRSIAIGQHFFTPQDISRRDLIVQDRPYSGWLFLTLGKEQTVLGGEERCDERTASRFSFGVIGPAAQGEWVQTEWHQLFNIGTPEGWDYQLRNEPGVVATWRRDNRWFYRKGPSNLDCLQMDLLTHYSGSVGNVLTQGEVGGFIRLGINLPRDWGARVSNPPDSLMAASEPNWDLHFFGGVEGRTVIQDISTDGNYFSSDVSHHVTREPFVGDLQYGVSVRLWQVRISYTGVDRSHEFREQGSSHRFGSLNLVVELN